MTAIVGVGFGTILGECTEYGSKKIIVSAVSNGPNIYSLR
jgi:hypothetical protein